MASNRNADPHTSARRNYPFDVEVAIRALADLIYAEYPNYPLARLAEVYLADAGAVQPAAGALDRTLT